MNPSQEQNSNSVSTSTLPPSSLPTVRLRPAVDLVEGENDFVMSVEMPGVDHAHVDVAIEKRVLTITGTANFSPPEGYRLVAGDPGQRVYKRSFQLSDDLDSGGIDAEVRDGVLTLRIPKSPTAKRTTIAIKAG